MSNGIPNCPVNNYSTLHFVDAVESNLLFRGGNPLSEVYDPSSQQCVTVYDYQGLSQAISDNWPVFVARPEPFAFYLVEISLLHPEEVTSIEFALSFFNANPSKGRIHLWDTDGTPRCYFNTAPAERERQVTTLEQWLPDPLIWRVATLRRMLEPSQLPMPVVVYVHCDGGCDRTAELIGAYRLRYMQDSWLTVVNDQPCGRPLGCDNYRALQWYAVWLNQTLGFSISGIGEDPGCTDPGGTHQPCAPAPPGGR